MNFTLKIIKKFSFKKISILNKIILKKSKIQKKKNKLILNFEKTPLNNLKKPNLPYLKKQDKKNKRNKKQNFNHHFLTLLL